MPLDPTFTSDFKLKPGFRRAGPKESVEMQLGRSDFLLGELQSRNPFPPEGTDAKEWTRGWLAEKQVELQNQQHGAANAPQYRFWKPAKRKAA